MRTPDVVVIVGPPLCGAGSLVRALRPRLPGQTVCEPHEVPAGRCAAAVVFVVSAAAPLTRSALDLLDAAACRTDAVVAALSKIDVHRRWDEVLAADRVALAEHRPRYRSVRWIPVAACPAVGNPVLDDLVEALHAVLGRADIVERNRLRHADNERDAALERRRRESDERTLRAAASERRRLARAARSLTLRGRFQQVRLQSAGEVRERCAELRAELTDAAATAAAGRAESFRRTAEGRFAQVADDINRSVTRRLAEVAADCDVHADFTVPAADLRPPTVDIPGPPLRRPALERGLTALLGAGFGVGAALTLARLMAGLVPVGTPVAVAGCLVAGGGLGAWVVYARRLLAERAALQRWAADATLRLRAALDDRVAARVVAVEIAAGVAASERDV